MFEQIKNIDLLKTSAILLIPSGLYPEYYRKWWYKYLKVFSIICICYNVVPQSYFLYINRYNVTSTTRVILIYLFSYSTTIKVYLMTYYRKEIHRLMELLKELRANKLKTGNINNFIEGEKHFDKLGSVCFYTYAPSFFVYSVLPMFYQFYKYITNTATEDTYRDPFENVYWFDTSFTPVYQIHYFFGLLNAFFVTITALSVDSLFYGFCIYIVTMYRELVDQMNEANELFIATKNSKELAKNLIECVDSHNKLHDFKQAIEDIFSSCISMQYAQSSISICCCVFLSLVYPVYSMQFLMYILFIFSGNMELFIYCWAGTLVTNESLVLARSFYFLNWYEYGVNERKILLLMLQKAQRKNNIRGLNFFNCDMQSFGSIINVTVSALAVLQSLNNK